jgi:hypothetical protein
MIDFIVVTIILLVAGLMCIVSYGDKLMSEMERQLEDDSHE